MSILHKAKQLENEIAAKMTLLEDLKASEEYQKDIEFEEKLRALMGKFSVGLPKIISILDPKGSIGVTKPVARRTRMMKTFVNPHTGETIETKGGNHKLLKEWRVEYGSEKVDSWLKKDEGAES